MIKKVEGIGTTYAGASEIYESQRLSVLGMHLGIEIPLYLITHQAVIVSK
jgi:hypothetical protein